MTSSLKLGNGKVVFVAFVQIVGHQFSSIVSLTQLIKIYNFQKPKQTIFIKNVVFQTHNLCTKPNRVFWQVYVLVVVHWQSREERINSWNVNDPYVKMVRWKSRIFCNQIFAKTSFLIRLIAVPNSDRQG